MVRRAGEEDAEEEVALPEAVLVGALLAVLEEARAMLPKSRAMEES